MMQCLQQFVGLCLFSSLEWAWVWAAECSKPLESRLSLVIIRPAINMKTAGHIYLYFFPPFFRSFKTLKSLKPADKECYLMCRLWPCLNRLRILKVPVNGLVPSYFENEGQGFVSLVASFCSLSNGRAHSPIFPKFLFLLLTKPWAKVQNCQKYCRIPLFKAALKLKQKMVLREQLSLMRGSIHGHIHGNGVCMCVWVCVCVCRCVCM